MAEKETCYYKPEDYWPYTDKFIENKIIGPKELLLAHYEADRAFDREQTPRKEDLIPKTAMDTILHSPYYELRNTESIYHWTEKKYIQWQLDRSEDDGFTVKKISDNVYMDENAFTDFAWYIIGLRGKQTKRPLKYSIPKKEK